MVDFDENIIVKKIIQNDFKITIWRCNKEDDEYGA
jgi:hypothetical protein